MRDGNMATRRFAGASVATIPSSRECTRENMAPHFHDDGTWHAGVMRLEGNPIFIGANNQAWRTLGYPAVHDAEMDAGTAGVLVAGRTDCPPADDDR